MYTRLLTPILSAFILTTSLQAQSGQHLEDSQFGSTLCEDSSLHFPIATSPISTLVYAKNSFDNEISFLPGLGFRAFYGRYGLDVSFSASATNHSWRNGYGTTSLERYYSGKALFMLKGRKDQLSGVYAGLGGGVEHKKISYAEDYSSPWAAFSLNGTYTTTNFTADAVIGYGWSLIDHGLVFLQFATKSPFNNGSFARPYWILETGIGF